MAYGYTIDSFTGERIFQGTLLGPYNRKTHGNTVLGRELTKEHHLVLTTVRHTVTPLTALLGREFSKEHFLVLITGRHTVTLYRGENLPRTSLCPYNRKANCFAFESCTGERFYHGALLGTYNRKAYGNTIDSCTGERIYIGIFLVRK